MGWIEKVETIVLIFQPNEPGSGQAPYRRHSPARITRRRRAVKIVNTPIIGSVFFGEIVGEFCWPTVPARSIGGVVSGRR